VCELRLSGVSLWALAFLAYCVLLYRISGFLGGLKKYLLGASASFFFGGAYAKAMSLRISF
jgi:hypothetical protein